MNKIKFTVKDHIFREGQKKVAQSFSYLVFVAFLLGIYLVGQVSLKNIKTHVQT